MFIHSFVPFPANFLAIANDMVYGSLWGAAITWAGAMMGAFLAFGLARKFGQTFLRRIFTRMSNPVDEQLGCSSWRRHALHKPAHSGQFFQSG